MAEGIVERVIGPNGDIVEVVVKAPIAEMRIAAQSAGFEPPTAEETAEIAMAVAQEEYDEAARQKLAGSTIATITLALAHMILKGQHVQARVGADGAEIRIPREVIDLVTDGKLGISETADRDVILRWRTRAERPIEPEEMRI